MNKDILVNSIMKTAGFKMGIQGAAIGSGLGAMKADKNNSMDPNKTTEDKAVSLAGNAAGGAVIGGVATSVAGKQGKKIFNAGRSMASSIGGMFKKSEIEIPDEKDKEDMNIKSPTEEEKRRMISCIDKYKEDIEKEAESYMEPIVCENCGFEGEMNSCDGRCPSCESMSGVKAKDVPIERSDNLPTKEEQSNKLHDEINNAKKDVMSYY